MLALAPQLPVDMVTPRTPQLLLTAACVTVALVALAAAVRLRIRTGSAVLLLLMLGAAIGSLNEAVLDIFVSAYYPPRGQWTAYQAFGRSIPLWVPFAHVILFAGAPYLLAQAMHRFPARRTGWIAVAALSINNTIIELPNLAAHHYVYYGGQPFRIGGFPLAMLAVNAVTMTAIAVAVFLGERFLSSGRRQLLWIGLPLLALPGSTIAIGFPVFTAVASGLPTPVKYAAALVTIGLAVLAIHGLLELAADPEGMGLGQPARSPAQLPPRRRQLMCDEFRRAASSQPVCESF